MKSKLKKLWGLEFSSLSSMMKWIQLHSIAASIVFQLCYSFTITHRRVQLIGKSQNNLNSSYVDKSDVLTVTPDGSLYPSSADMSFTALICLLDTWRFSYGWWKHAGTNSIYCPNHNAVHENTGFAPSTVVWPSTWHSCYFGSRFLVTT